MIFFKNICASIKSYKFNSFPARNPDGINSKFKNLRNNTIKTGDWLTIPCFSEIIQLKKTIQNQSEFDVHTVLAPSAFLITSFPSNHFSIS